MRGLLKARLHFISIAAWPEREAERFHRQQVLLQIPLLASLSAYRVLARLSHPAIHAKYWAELPLGSGVRPPVGETGP